MNTEWSTSAYIAAVEAAATPPKKRHRQAAWDAENMVTESTRFTVEQDAELRRVCKEAGICRYQLISYLLRTFMAAWDAGKGRKDGRKTAPN